MHIPYGNAKSEDQKAFFFAPKDVKKRILAETKDSNYNRKDPIKRPDGYDCHVRSKRLGHDDFTDEEKEWLNSQEKFEPGDYIDSGAFGDVHELKDNPEFVIKTPRKTANGCQRIGITHEDKTYRRLSMDRMSMMTPSRTVKLEPDHSPSAPSYCQTCPTCIGLIRSRVMPASKDRSAWTDDKINELRDKVWDLSQQGIIFNDGIQAGLDKNGKILQYDTDRFIKPRQVNKKAIANAINSNAIALRAFLMEDLGMTREEAMRYLKG